MRQLIYELTKCVWENLVTIHTFYIRSRLVRNAGNFLGVKNDGFKYPELNERILILNGVLA